MTDAEQRKLIPPASVAVGLTGLSGYLVWFALQAASGRNGMATRSLTNRDAMFAEMTRELAALLGVPGSIALAAATSALVWGWVAVVVRGIRRARRDVPAPPAASVVATTPLLSLEPILADEIRAWRGQLHLGGLLLAGVSAVGGVALWKIAGEAEGIGTAVVGLVFGAGLVLAALRDPRRHAVLARLVHAPHAVVWIYVAHAPEPKPAWLARLMRSEPFGTLHVGFDDGTLREIPVRRGREDAVWRAVTTQLPETTQGYSPEAQAQFATSARSLRLPPGGGG